VRVNLLGPVRVDRAEGCEVPLDSAKDRSLLAALALRPGSVMAVDALVDAIWGESAPPSARKTLQTYVSNLRRALGPTAIVTHPTGYSLTLGTEDTDVGCFRTLVREGEQALRAGHAVPAGEALAAAVALGRGRPLQGVGPNSGLAAEAVRLEEEFLSALETRIEADLAAGSGAELVGELGILVHEHPFRERLWAFLLVALYRSGRQADALAAYQQARLLLRDELGLEPGGELQRLERAILVHDPSLLVVPVMGSTNSHRPEVRRSPVRYAETPDGTHIAYQIVGNGPLDVLAIPGFVSHLDMWWESPTDQLVTKLASFSRLILFDKRGMGLSDRPENVDVEHWVEDAAAVMDAAGSKQAVILGISAGVPTALLFAAKFPHIVRSLVLYGGFTRMLAGDGNEFGHDPAAVDGYIKHMEANWGTGVGISNLAPSRTFDPAAREYWARIQTRSASPAAAARFLRALADIDVRHVLSSISSPTLILHATRDQNVQIGVARAMRDEIEGAQLVELDSDIHLIWLSDVIDEATRHIDDFISKAAYAGVK